MPIKLNSYLFSLIVSHCVRVEGGLGWLHIHMEIYTVRFREGFSFQCFTFLLYLTFFRMSEFIQHLYATAVPSGSFRIALNRNAGISVSQSDWRYRWKDMELLTYMVIQRITSNVIRIRLQLKSDETEEWLAIM